MAPTTSGASALFRITHPRGVPLTIIYRHSNTILDPAKNSLQTYKGGLVKRVSENEFRFLESKQKPIPIAVRNVTR